MNVLIFEETPEMYNRKTQNYFGENIYRIIKAGGYRVKNNVVDIGKYRNVKNNERAETTGDHN